MHYCCTKRHKRHILSNSPFPTCISISIVLVVCHKEISFYIFISLWLFSAWHTLHCLKALLLYHQIRLLPDTSLEGGFSGNKYLAHFSKNLLGKDASGLFLASTWLPQPVKVFGLPEILVYQMCNPQFLEIACREHTVSISLTYCRVSFINMVSKHWWDMISW